MSAATATVEAPGRAAGGRGRRWRPGPVDTGALIVLAGLALVFSLSAPGFASTGNARSIALSIAVVACLGLGQNLVMLAGEIDVSVGSIVALAGFAVGPVGSRTDSLLITVVGAVAVGALAGLLNGLLVAWTPVPSIVVTLGTLYVFQGVALLLSDGRNIVSFPSGAGGLGSGDLAGVPRAVLVVVAAFLILLLVRHHTAWGRDLLAIGGHRHAARTMGVRVRRGLVIAFVLSGAASGLGAAIYLGAVGGMQTSIVDSNLALQVIAAVAIGGTSIEGGRGTDLAPLTGAAIVGVITGGVVILGVPGVWIPCAYGVCLLLAVGRDRLLETVRPAGARRG